MPQYKLTQGKLVSGKGKNRKVFGKGDKVTLSVEQAKRHGMEALERVEETAKGEASEPQLTTNPAEPKVSDKAAAKTGTTAKK